MHFPFLSIPTRSVKAERDLPKTESRPGFLKRLRYLKLSGLLQVQLTFSMLPLRWVLLV
jgi:hypothetical protein